jgi:DNA polymerase I-like protein with 3'-5' exonuclease and polymerase domains
LLWTLNRVFEYAEKVKWQSRPIMQIHDAMVVDFVTKEVRHILKVIKDIAEVQTRKKFKWINVPLTIEAELAPVNRSWAEVKEVKI